MINRIKQLLNLDDDADPYQRVDLALHDLDMAVDSITRQLSRINIQESQILLKLQSYRTDYASKRTAAKKAYQLGEHHLAKNALTETQILKKQIQQYKKIITEIQDTKQRLLTQKNQFTFTRDQIASRVTLGEAQVDASQLNADVSEQLMLINESGELQQYEDLIAEADYRTQAIKEIQGSEDLLDNYIDQSVESGMENLDEEIKKDKEEKLRESLKKQRKVIEQVFGKMDEQEDKILQTRKEILLRELKQCNGSAPEQTDRIDTFFNEHTHIPNTSDHEDRINNFFHDPHNSAKSQKAKKANINQFFNTK